MGLGKIFTTNCAQLHVLFAEETILSSWMGLRKFQQKCVPRYTFFRCGDHLKFWIGLRKVSTKASTSFTFLAVQTIWVFDGTWKVSTKSCDQLHIFGSTDYRKFLMGLGKIFTKKCAQLHVVFAVETKLSFWWDLKSFDKKVWPVTHFFAVQTVSSFWWDLEKFRQNGVTSYTVLTLWRPTQVFDGTWKTFHNKLCPVTRFVRWGDYLKFLDRTQKNSNKNVCPVTRFFAVETILSFG